MKWEWGVGEVLLIVLALYELWSLRKYKKQDEEARRSKAAEDGTRST